jgi:hypothetical protein
MSPTEKGISEFQNFYDCLHAYFEFWSWSFIYIFFIYIFVCVRACVGARAHSGMVTCDYINQVVHGIWSYFEVVCRQKKFDKHCYRTHRNLIKSIVGSVVK